jgi:predicted nucleic-acid-binding Zn-ribbon protein
MKTKTHKFEDRSCKHCGIMEEYAEDEPCEKEDLSMWCAPGQSVQEMLKIQAEKN